MNHVYVLTNQHQQFLSKSNEWIDGRESSRLFRSEHKDVVINQMFEANTRDVSLRIELLQCELNGKGQPQIPQEALGEMQETGDPRQPQEMPVENPAEVPPGQAPEVEPQPAPEVTPDEPPEISPEEPPEIQPEQPDEASAGSGILQAG